MMYGSRRYGAFAACLIAAFLLGPRYVLFKLKRQVLTKGSLVEG